MKQRTIQSQTTPQCNHQPKPSDYQISAIEYIKVNLIQAFKLAIVGGFFITAFVIFTSILTGYFGA